MNCPITSTEPSERQYDFDIRWSAPYSFDFYSNHLEIFARAFGVPYAHQRRGHDYYYDSNAMYVTTDYRYKLIATMGTDHHPVIKASILPLKSDNLFRN